MAANRKPNEQDQLNSKCPRFQGNPGASPQGVLRELAKKLIMPLTWAGALERAKGIEPS